MENKNAKGNKSVGHNLERKGLKGVGAYEKWMKDHGVLLEDVKPINLAFNQIEDKMVITLSSPSYRVNLYTLSNSRDDGSPVFSLDGIREKVLNPKDYTILFEVAKVFLYSSDSVHAERAKEYLLEKIGEILILSEIKHP